MSNTDQIRALAEKMSLVDGALVRDAANTIDAYRAELLTRTSDDELRRFADSMVEFNDSTWRDSDCNCWLHPPVRRAGEYVASRQTAMSADQMRTFLFWAFRMIRDNTIPTIAHAKKD